MLLAAGEVGGSGWPAISLDACVLLSTGVVALCCLAHAVAWSRPHEQAWLMAVLLLAPTQAATARALLAWGGPPGAAAWWCPWAVFARDLLEGACFFAFLQFLLAAMGLKRVVQLLAISHQHGQEAKRRAARQRQRRWGDPSGGFGGPGSEPLLGDAPSWEEEAAAAASLEAGWGPPPPSPPLHERLPLSTPSPPATPPRFLGGIRGGGGIGGGAPAPPPFVGAQGLPPPLPALRGPSHPAPSLLLLPCCPLLPLSLFWPSVLEHDPLDPLATPPRTRRYVAFVHLALMQAREDGGGGGTGGHRETPDPRLFLPSVDKGAMLAYSLTRVCRLGPDRDHVMPLYRARTLRDCLPVCRVWSPRSCSP